MQTQIRWCAGCRDDQVFEQPVCDDGPEGTAELCCAMCGLGVFDSVLVAIVDDAAPPRQTRAA